MRKLAALAAMGFAVLVQLASAQNISYTTFAGAAGLSGSADGTGAAARFTSPQSVAVAPDGTIWVGNSNSLRKVTPAGVVTTVSGYSFPAAGIAFDAAGNAYIADSATHVIRKVSTAGAMTIAAGQKDFLGNADGPAASARFNQPSGLAFDAAGNLYVADTGNHAIRRLSTSGEVTTVAGSPGVSGTVDGAPFIARFSYPKGIIANSDGSLYVSDSTVIRVVAADGMVASLAGRPGWYSSADGTGSAAQFTSIVAMTRGADGNLYVSENGTVVRRVTPAGVVTTVGGGIWNSGSADGIGNLARFSGLAGIAGDASGNLYLADSSNHTLRKAAMLLPPSIVTQPSSATVSALQTAVFAVVASSTRTVTYQWERRQAGGLFTPLNDGGGVAGARTASLSVSATTYYMHGNEFRCVLDNGSGSTVVSAVVTLSVTASPLMMSGASAGFHAGIAGSYSVEATGSPAPTYEITSGTLPSWASWDPVSGRIWGTPTSTAGSPFSLTIRASNGVGSAVVQTLIITVDPTPTQAVITLDVPSNNVIARGNSCTLSATASGTAPMAYQWTRNGRPLPGATTTTHTITNASRTDQGYYQLVVSNPAGSFRSKAMFVTIAYPQTEVVTWGSEVTLPSGLTNVTRVAAASYGAVALLTTGAVVNLAGSVSVPDGLSNVVEVTGGSEHWLALQSDGKVVAWGGNSSGQCNVPSGLSDVVAVAAGSGHSLALTKDGTVVAWGASNYVPAGLADIVAIAASGNMSVALRIDGTTAMWGSTSSSTPPADWNNIVAITARDSTLYGVRADGRVIVWGYSSWIGVPPEKVNNVSEVAVSNYQAVALRKDGTVVAWGDNYNSTIPMRAGLQGVFAVAANYGTRFAVRDTSGDRAPTIVTPLQSVAANKGQTHVFRAGIGSGTANVAYQWYKDNVAIAGATAETLSVTVSTATAGRYHAVATNSLGTITTAAATVSANSTPVVSATTPGRYPLTAGESLTLTLAPSIPNTATVQWRRNGLPLVGATARSYLISNATISNAGWYQAVYDDGSGAVKSAPIFVVVAPAATHVIAIGGQNSSNANVPPGLGRVTEVVARGSVSATVNFDGTVTRWNDSYSSPLPAMSNVVSAVLGEGRFFALFGDGTVQMWTSNYYSSSGATNAPETFTNVVSISFGGTHLLGLRSDGTVVSWPITSEATPASSVPPTLNDVVAVAAGGGFSLALRSDGTVVGWGRNEYGQSVPPTGLSGVGAVAAMGTSSAVLRSDGTVVTWGNLTRPGQALAVPAGLSRVVSISAGESRVQAVLEDGTAVVWGGYSYWGDSPFVLGVEGEIFGSAGGSSFSLFVRDATYDTQPLITVQPASTALYTNQAVTLSVKASGGTSRLKYQWYKNGTPVAGATTDSLYLPPATNATAGSYSVQVSNQLGSVQSTAAVVTVNPIQGVTVSPKGRQVVASGQSLTFTASVGMSGPASFQWMRNGVPVAGATSSTFTLSAIRYGDAGVYQVQATNAAGPAISEAAHVLVNAGAQVIAWGSNDYGQASIPLNAATDVVKVSAGSTHTLALKSNGTIVAWGANSAGQCDIPVDISDVVDIAAGGSFSMALLGDGTVRTWGAVNYTPVDVAECTAIAASHGSYAMALRLDGTVAVWNSGGTKADAFASVSRVVAIAAGSSHCLALQSDGRIVQWGGSGKVPQGLHAVAIATSGYTSYALLNSGNVAEWRYDSSNPVADVSVVTDAVSLTATDSTVFALRSAGTLAVWRSDSWSNMLEQYAQAAAPVLQIDGGQTHVLALRDPSGDVTPSIEAFTVDQAVTVGQALTLSVTASGIPAPAYQWYLNGQAINGATRSTFSVSQVSAWEAGTYTVAVSNAKGRVVSGPIVVTVKPISGSVGILASTVRANAGADVLFGTFTIEGSAKNVLVRAVGPALAAFGVTAPMADPQLTITDANGVVLASNDDWGDTPDSSLVSAATTAGAYALPNGSKDAACLRRYSPGTYHVQVSAASGASGAAMLEVYDVDRGPRLVYQATLGRAGAGSGVLVQGLSIAEPPVDRSYLVRATGPSLGLPDALDQPVITIFDGAGTQLATNAGWENSSDVASLAAAVGAQPFPSGSRDAALRFTPARQGVYAIQVTGSGAGSGLVLIELFEHDAMYPSAVAPAISAPPLDLTVLPGQDATLSAVFVGNPAPAFQWRKNGVPISGATNAKLTLTGVTSGDSGVYSVKASNASGTASSRDAKLTVATQSATHSVVGIGYVPGGTVSITNTFSFAGDPSSLAWQVTIPAGWSFVSSSASAGDIKPAPGTTGTLEWAWTAPPSSPITFTYTLNVPAGETGTKLLSGSSIVRFGGTPLTQEISPASLRIDESPATHSADTNADFRILLLELTRVIELYNARNGTSRTGCYTVDPAGEDGFATDVTRSGTATVTLTRYHAADSNHDGRIGLLELTRVIELYNYRSGATRTGQYHVQAGTEDGFAPGP